MKRKFPNIMEAWGRPPNARLVDIADNFATIGPLTIQKIMAVAAKWNVPTRTPSRVSFASTITPQARHQILPRLNMIFDKSVILRATNSNVGYIRRTPILQNAFPRPRFAI